MVKKGTTNIRIYWSTWKKLTKLIKPLKDETAAKYFDRVYEKLWWATEEEAKRQELAE